MKKISMIVVLAMLVVSLVGCIAAPDKEAFVDEGKNEPVIQEGNDNTNVPSDKAEDENADEKADEVPVEEPDDNQTQEPAEKEESKVPEQSDKPEKVDFDIVSVDGNYEYNIYSTDETVTLKVKTKNTDGESVDFQWYRCDEKGNKLSDYNYGHPLSMGDSLEVSGIAYDEMLLPRYYLVNAMVKNTLKSKVFSVTLCPMGVEYEEEEIQGGEESFYVVSADGWYEYNVAVDESITLTAKVENNGEQYADYQWNRCDEYGNPLDGDSYGHPLSFGESLTIEAIPYEEMLVPRYYVVRAMIGNTVREAIFKVTLVPTGGGAEPTV